MPQKLATCFFRSKQLEQFFASQETEKAARLCIHGTYKQLVVELKNSGFASLIFDTSFIDLTYNLSLKKYRIITLMLIQFQI